MNFLKGILQGEKLIEPNGFSVVLKAFCDLLKKKYSTLLNPYNLYELKLYNVNKLVYR